MPPSNRKVALVTGSGKRRVGNAVIEALAGRGYAVAVHYHRSAAEASETVVRLKEQGRTAQAFQADVTNQNDVARLFDDVQGSFGRLDVLVTAASIYDAEPLERITADQLRAQFDVNVLGTFLACQRAGLIMAGQPEGGAIVTIADWAIERPYPDYGAYLTSKGAIPTLTRMLAVELSLRNPAVRVNCILPGPVLFPPDMPEAERQQAIAGTLLRREGRPEHVAHAVLFLVENDFVTGVCLPVDGGRTLAGIEHERARNLDAR
jgi:pteridine reductase